jgi:hypothetical protein
MKTMIIAAITILSLGAGVGLANATPPTMHHRTIR